MNQNKKDEFQGKLIMLTGALILGTIGYGAYCLKNHLKSQKQTQTTPKVEQITQYTPQQTQIFSTNSSSQETITNLENLQKESQRQYYLSPISNQTPKKPQIENLLFVLNQDYQIREIEINNIELNSNLTLSYSKENGENTFHLQYKF